MSSNPFLPPPSDRDPVRRFRGRLATPVTILTTGEDHSRTGITVSSLVVIEGEPGLVRAVVGPVSDAWHNLDESRRLVVHVCDRSHHVLGDVFAQIRPNPGGLCAGVAHTQSAWGPVLDDIPTRLYATVTGMEPVGWSGMVTATIDRVEIGDLSDPLVYFRGRYRGLD